ncbi:MAG TPA: (Fe-S)-binding protein [Polyangiaceae bacterium]|nr:(Fe-S)-binding protein [Polyangiaceae bacterium]
MSPTAMLTLMFAAIAMFAWSASRRWQLIQIGRPASRLDHIDARLRGTWRFAFRQEKMDYYNPAGLAHKFIFFGFIVLQLRTMVLWGRGYYAPFDLFVLNPSTPLGEGYEFLKDIMGALVVLGTLVFFYYRIVVKPKRMSLSFEGIVILLIISSMMIADMTYDGASLVLASKAGAFCSGTAHTGTVGQCAAVTTILAPIGDETWQGAWSIFPAPMGSLFAAMFAGLSPAVLIWVARAGFWTHATLPLIFLNLLPHSKHFHVITAIPNIFLRSLLPAGRLEPMAENAEKLMEVVGAAAEAPDPMALPVGVARIEHFSWKAILDFYTCTECGRCSDNCPAHRTGKVLSPKHLTLALRDHLYGREDELIAHRGANGAAKPAPADGASSDAASADGAAASPASTDGAAASNGIKAINLVPDVVHPDVLWACTSCRACEEQCPVLISYVDKIIDMRRNLVMVKGEFPHELAKPFQGMETNGNPWNLSRMDRSGWADGLGIPTMAENPKTPVLYWVGCAASYDDRAKKIARATARLLKQAGVDFAILGQEESCTGDPARRAGNEFLFAMLAEGNAGTINGYKEQGGVRTIVTTCPHCFNSLKNEYPDFGLKVEVVHHTDFLLGLVAEGRLVPTKPVEGRVVYHDSCYLGRYNGVYDPPREILKRIPGVELVEPEYWTKQRGLCCGAGGAQMWMEEQNADRVNVKRTLQLLDTGAKTIATACPFCMTMLTDGVKSKNLEDSIKQMDVVELLDRSCEAPAIARTVAALPPEPPPAAEATAEE